MPIQGEAQLPQADCSLLPQECRVVQEVRNQGEIAFEAVVLPLTDEPVIA